MKQQAYRAVAFAVAFGFTFILGVCVADAFVLANKSDVQKLRKDVDKQNDKHASCVIKALLKCEAKGGDSGEECHTDTGVVDYGGDPVLDPKSKQPGKFNSAMAKCDKKMNLSKKGTDYVGIGCPGDCDPVADGVQQCPNLAAYEAALETSLGGSVRFQLPVFAALIDSLCQTDTGEAIDSTAPAQIDCVTNNADTLARYFKGLSKCYAKCENDYKDKKGDGGNTDDPNCIANDAGADPAFKACVDKALAKAEKKNPLSPTNKAVGLPLANDAFDGPQISIYNRFDPVVPGGNPCSTCGNGTRKGLEQCDGIDDALCVGLCNSDCTCP
jgi:hypothetical protein